MRKQMCPVPPGSGLKPIYGTGAPTLLELAALRKDRDQVWRERRLRFGDMTYMNLFRRKFVMPMIPEAIETIAMNRERAFANEPAWDFSIGVAFKRGILLMDFDEHRQHRQILQQAFTNGMLKGYLQQMQPMIMDRIASFPTGSVRLADEFKTIILDVALEVFVGLQLSRVEGDRINRAFLDCVEGLQAFVRKPIPGGKWRSAVNGRRTLEEFFYARLPHKRQRESPDLFSVLCHVESEDGAMFSDEDVVNHMIFVLFAAHDTSTTAITTMLYYMAKNPQWQERARAHSLALPTEISYEDIKSLTVQDLILKEALRLNAPVPILARQAVSDTEVCGYYIPRGAYIMASPQAVHVNPQVWTSPEIFDPERFLPERAEDKVHRFAWFPFGGGAHKCIGLYFAQMEIKTMMHNFLRGYQWTVPPDYTWKLDPMTLGAPIDGLLAQVTKR